MRSTELQLHRTARYDNVHVIFEKAIWNPQLTWPVSVRTNGELCAGQPVPSRTKDIEIVLITLAGLVFPLVLLRLWSRYSIAEKLWWDDLLIGVSTVSTRYYGYQCLTLIILLSVGISCVRGIAGRP